MKKSLPQQRNLLALTDMPPHGENLSYVEITCQQVSGSQILNLCRQLSSLLAGENVYLRAADQGSPSGFTLRVYVPDRSNPTLSESIQSRLRDAQLLDRCQVTLGGPDPARTVQLWPLPED